VTIGKSECFSKTFFPDTILAICYVFTREYTQCTAGYTFCFVVVVVGGGGAGVTFNQTWQFQLTVDET
jgi:hypothetical protein